MIHNPTSLGQRLRTARLKAGYNKARLLAGDLGVTANTYYRYERDESTPPYKVLVRLTSLLNVPLSQLLDDDAAQKTTEPTNQVENKNPGYSQSPPSPIPRSGNRFNHEHTLCSVLAWRLASSLAEKMQDGPPSGQNARMRLAAELYLALKTSPALAIARIKDDLEFEHTLWSQLSEYLSVYHSLLEKTLGDESVAK